ncbi:MAG: phytochelatin synthase family protein [Archangium sp.]|nr:phytochelatin synthase family protein [Archangium sp.]MDP3575614.1 phytochelatin synthase family protein [Archangium sp.]
MKKRGIATALLLIALAGAALSLRQDPPPPGFVSIKFDPAFQNPAFLERAWALPVAKTFPHPLISQTNPSACGPTAVSNVLRSSGATTTSDEVASHGSGCFSGICFGGLTLAQLADAARTSAPGWTVTELHPATLEDFRAAVRQANDPARRLLINFTRRPLFGAGGGHHSPIGGYLEAEDLVFVLDVNESFGPWLVSSARLFEAMDTVDSSSGVKRGLLEMTR